MSEWMLSVYKSLVPRFAARRVAYDTVRLESEIGEQNKSADPSPLGSWFLGRLYRRWTLPKNIENWLLATEHQTGLLCGRRLTRRAYPPREARPSPGMRYEDVSYGRVSYVSVWDEGSTDAVTTELRELCQRVRERTCSIGTVLLRISQTGYDGRSTMLHRVGLLVLRSANNRVKILIHTGGMDWGVDLAELVQELQSNTGAVVEISHTHRLQALLVNTGLDTGMCRWYVLLFLVVAIRLKRVVQGDLEFEHLVRNSETMLVTDLCAGDLTRSFQYVAEFAQCTWERYQHTELRKRGAPRRSFS